MNEKQTQELIGYIELDLEPGAARAHQLGNGDWCVILRSQCYFLWSFGDYMRYRLAEAKKQTEQSMHPAAEPVHGEHSYSQGIEASQLLLPAV